MISKKDFIKIASIINNADTGDTGDRDYGEYYAREKIANKLAKYFKSINPRFNKNKFLKVAL